MILSEHLLQREFNVVLALFPEVAESQARAFFLTSQRTSEQIDNVLDAVADELSKLRNGPPLVSLVATR